VLFFDSNKNFHAHPNNKIGNGSHFLSILDLKFSVQFISKQKFLHPNRPLKMSLVGLPVGGRFFFYSAHFFSIYRTRILLMQITKLGQRCIRRIGKEHFVSAGCDRMIWRQPATAPPAIVSGGYKRWFPSSIC
jgi:hypothetical protein